MVHLGFRLLVITLIAGLALALTYHVTAPIKEARGAQALQEALQAVFPGAQMEEVDLSSYGEDERFDNVAAAYRAVTDTESGYILITGAKGYKSVVWLTVGITDDGEVKGVVVNSHDESAGIGDRILQDTFLKQFTGLAAPVEFGTDGVESISGATYSSRAVKNAINLAAEAALILEEAQP